MSLSTSELQAQASQIRQDIIQMLLKAGSGHSAGPLGMADVFTALYFSVVTHHPHEPHWSDRDRVVLSNGHICPVLYATLARSGYFPVEELMTLRKINSRLQGHPSRVDLPGVEVSAGPLGQGISQAIGMALAGRMDQKSYRTYCLMSDGEHDEGQTWEAILYASKEKLHNLTVIVDRNNIQIDGFTEDILPLESLPEKYLAFGWHVLEIDGQERLAIGRDRHLGQHVAIGLGARQRDRTERAGRTRLVVGDDLDAEDLAGHVVEGAHHDVGGAAGRPWHDHAHRLAREIGGPGGCRQAQRESEQHEQAGHSFLPGPASAIAYPRRLAHSARGGARGPELGSDHG